MADIVVKLARKSVFVGSHVRAHLEIDAASALAVDDLDVELDPPEAGVVSWARGADWAPDAPYVTVLAGHQLGKVRVRVVERRRHRGRAGGPHDDRQVVAPAPSGTRLLVLRPAGHQPPAGGRGLGRRAARAAEHPAATPAAGT